jgi:hypothetical protein
MYPEPRYRSEASALAVEGNGVYAHKLQNLPQSKLLFLSNILFILLSLLLSARQRSLLGKEKYRKTLIDCAVDERLKLCEHKWLNLSERYSF